MIHYGTVTNGKLVISHRASFDNDLRKFEGVRVELSLEKAKKKRSDLQNRYLWGLVYDLALQGFMEEGHEGLSKDDIHYFFKKRHLPDGKQIADPITGEVTLIPRSTTTLGTVEFIHYVEMIAKDLAEWFGIVVPEPNTELV